MDAEDLTAGIEWEKKIYAEVERAEVMLFLASEKSLDPKSFSWKEVLKARCTILAVTLGGLSSQDVRLGRALEGPAQARPVMAVDAEPLEDFPFVSPRDQSEGKARLNRKRVEGIGQTLRELGVAPNSFTWTSKREGPFPGLRPPQEGDEAVFCGRDLETRDGIKVLGDPRGTVTQCVLLIQAPSAAGKFSFLRAGLWRRLRRHPGFTPLAIIRTQGGAATSGLGSSGRAERDSEAQSGSGKELGALPGLADGCRRGGLARPVGEIRRGGRHRGPSPLRPDVSPESARETLAPSPESQRAFASLRHVVGEPDIRQRLFSVDRPCGFNGLEFDQHLPVDAHPDSTPYRILRIDPPGLPAALQDAPRGGDRRESSSGRPDGLAKCLDRAVEGAWPRKIREPLRDSRRAGAEIWGEKEKAPTGRSLRVTANWERSWRGS